MANPQLEEGYTAIANEILEQLYKRYLSPNQWQVILCVARKTYGFRKKTDFISTSQIPQETELCPSVTSRVLNSLQAANMIVREGRNIGIQKDWEKWLPVTKRPRNFSNAANISHMANNEAKFSNAANNEKLAKLSTKISQTVNSVSNAANKTLAMRLNTKEIKETTTKETIQKKYIIPDWIDGETFEAFIEMRKKIKKPLTDHAINVAIKKLDGFRKAGEDPNEILNEAILRNWQGLWPLKDKNQGGQNGKVYGQNAGRNEGGRAKDEPAGSTGMRIIK